MLEGSNKAALAAAAFAAAAEQNEAVLNALRRKELNEIHERIQAALDVFEAEETFDGGGGSGDDDDSEDGGGGGEGASAEALEAAKEKLMVMLLEYKTTCSSRRAVLGQMDAGLAKLVEIAADGGGGGAAAATPRDDDAEVEALVEAAESAAVGEMAEGMRGQQAQLRALHGEQISLLTGRLAELAPNLAVAEQREAGLRAALDAADATAARAAADRHALVGEVGALERAARLAAARAREAAAAGDAKRAADREAAKAAKAEVETQRRRADAAEAAAAALDARQKDELAAAEARLTAERERRERAEAELASARADGDAARAAAGETSGAAEELEEARRQLTEANATNVRLHALADERKAEGEAEVERVREEAAESIASLMEKLKAIKQRMQDKERQASESGNELEQLQQALADAKRAEAEALDARLAGRREAGAAAGCRRRGARRRRRRGRARRRRRGGGGGRRGARRSDR